MRLHCLNGQCLGQKQEVNPGRFSGKLPAHRPTQSKAYSITT